MNGTQTMVGWRKEPFTCLLQEKRHMTHEKMSSEWWWGSESGTEKQWHRRCNMGDKLRSPAIMGPFSRKSVRISQVCGRCFTAQIVSSYQYGAEIECNTHTHTHIVCINLLIYVFGHRHKSETGWRRYNGIDEKTGAGPDRHRQRDNLSERAFSREKNWPLCIRTCSVSKHHTLNHMHHSLHLSRSNSIDRMRQAMDASTQQSSDWGLVCWLISRLNQHTIQRQKCAGWSGWRWMKWHSEQGRAQSGGIEDKQRPHKRHRPAHQIKKCDKCGAINRRHASHIWTVFVGLSEPGRNWLRRVYRITVICQTCCIHMLGPSSFCLFVTTYLHPKM